MKKIVLPFLLLLIGSFAAAQSFSVGTNSSTNTIEANSRVLDDTVAVTNLTANQITLEWEKDVISAPSSWQIWVCSDLSCYPPSTNGGTWDISGSGHGDLSLHINPGTEVGTGEIHLRLWNTRDTTDSQTIVFTVDAITDVRTFPMQEIKVYPNPANDVLGVKWELYEFDEANLEILTLQGQLLKSTEVLNGVQQVALDISDLAPGVYISRLSDASGFVFTRKFIKE